MVVLCVFVHIKIGISLHTYIKIYVQAATRERPERITNPVSICFAFTCGSMPVLAASRTHPRSTVRYYRCIFLYLYEIQIRLCKINSILFTPKEHHPVRKTTKCFYTGLTLTAVAAADELNSPVNAETPASETHRSFLFSSNLCFFRVCVCVSNQYSRA